MPERAAEVGGAEAVVQGLKNKGADCGFYPKPTGKLGEALQQGSDVT